MAIPLGSELVKFDFADTDSYPGTGTSVINLGPSSLYDGTITGAGFSSATDSLTYDSAGDRIVVTQSFYNVGVDNNFTVIVLFNRSAPLESGTQSLYSIPYRGTWDSLPYFGVYLGYDNANSRYAFNTNTSTNYVLSSFPITNTIGDWTVAAVTYSSGTATFYENGSIGSTVTGLPATIDLLNSTQLAIGVDAGFHIPAADQFTGQIGAFELHDAILSAGEISSISEDYLNRYAPVPTSVMGGRMFGEGFNG